ncbi:MAG TPA: peptidylprolyl isomerase [Casimicrobiaceae bacterium]|nr:peptidylprolyl isomerase [Casimicrobiaceae bacterium]
MTGTATTTCDSALVASVNGVPLHGAGAMPEATELRQRTCTELLRQAAQRAGMLPIDDVPATDGIISAAAAAAIERLVDREVRVTEPSDEACRRHYAAHPERYGARERLRLRHVLFAVTPGVDVNALRKRAEALLVSLRCADPASDAFAEAARQWSNCPSARQGGGKAGELGWMSLEECSPDFAREVFSRDRGARVGVLPQLVRSRSGLHIVEVQARASNAATPYEGVRESVASCLRNRDFVTALRQYLRLLADAAMLENIDLDATASPVLQ